MQHGGSVVSAVASQQEGPRFESRYQECPGFALAGVEPFCLEFACSPRVYMRSLQVLRFPPTNKKNMHVRHIRLGWPSVLAHLAAAAQD